LYIIENEDVQINFASAFIYGFLGFYVFFEIFQIPQRFFQQRKKDIYSAKKGLIKKLEDFYQEKLRDFKFNQNMQLEANKLLLSQIEINSETKKILSKALPKNSVLLSEDKIIDTLFSVLKQRKTFKKSAAISK
jgi:hypothetical protein